MNRQLTVEDINDIMDKKKYAMIEPGTMSMAQLAKSEGYKAKLPRPMPRPMLDTATKTAAVIAALKKHGPKSHRGLAKILDINPTQFYAYAREAIDTGQVELINPHTTRARFRLVQEGTEQ